jgi:hypothetical protein
MPRKKKEVNPVDKAKHDLTKSIVAPLYPAMLGKEEVAVELIDRALTTHKTVCVWQKVPENVVAKADMRLAVCNLREAIEKYTDEKTRKEVLKKIATLEEVTIGEKK